MKICLVCSKKLHGKQISFCSEFCSKRSRVDKDANVRTTGLPQSGEALLFNGEYYREGVHGLVFRWGLGEWVKSTTTKKDLKKAKPGRFLNATFVIDNTLSSKTARA